MKKSISVFVWILILLEVKTLEAQVAPYSLSPQWRFGINSGLAFPNGNFPTSGAPAATALALNPATDFIEASSSICDRTGAIMLYSNTMDIYNNTNTVQRSLRPAGDNVCAGSATSGSVMIPDPSNPSNRYYVFVANDLTGGSCGSRGVNYYVFQKNGLGQAIYVSGPTILAASNVTDESLTGGNDGNGNYWLASHSQSSNAFKLWRINAGGVAAIADQNFGANGNNFSQASIKFSPCMDKVAWASGGNFAIYDFNKTTGALSGPIRTWTNGAIHGDGLEFSPDGNILYYNAIAGIINWHNISANTFGTITGSTSWTIQLGPDGKIYTSPGGSTLGVINTPNSPTTTTYGSMAINGSTFRGISNIAWLSPQLPTIGNAGTCNMSYSFNFLNYFNTTIAVNSASIEWDFGVGLGWQSGLGATPTFDYTPYGTGTYTVNIRFNDTYCAQQWTASTSVSVTCVVPLEWLEVSGVTAEGGQANIQWSTSNEKNTSHFVLERSSDGVFFYRVGQNIPAKGGNASMNTYQTLDNSGMKKAYYRVLQYDTDGKFTYSKIIRLESPSQQMIVKPNPSEEDFTAWLEVNSTYLMTVTDMAGKEVYRQYGDADIIRFGAALDAGSYVLTVYTSEGVLHEKLIKK